ncbi:MAG: protein kinase domain-containing protein [Planctomycetota bacterium]|jgi:tRNA A-37 threonylcarbamoyl transferase component Bud32
MPPTPDWLLHAVIGGLVLLFILYILYKYVFLWRRFNHQRGQAYRANDWESVIEIGEKQLKYNRGYAPLYHDMAVALKKTGEFDRSFDMALKLQQELYFKIIGGKPAHPEDYGEINAFKNASSQYLRSLKILGETYLERGNIEIARDAFEYLSGMGGRFTECNLQLALCYLRMKDDISAANALRKLLTVIPVKAVKLLHTHMNELMLLSPQSAAMHEFQLDFLRAEGNVKDKIEELKNKISRGTGSESEFMILSTLVDSEGMHEVMHETLESYAEAAKGSRLPPSFDMLARKYNASNAVITSLTRKIDSLALTTEPLVIQDLEEDIINISMKNIDSKKLIIDAAVNLTRIGSAGKALIILDQSDFVPGESEVTELYKKIEQIWHRQILAENNNIIKNIRTETADLAEKEKGFDKIMPSSRYKRFLIGEDLSEDEIDRAAFDLTTALMKKGEASDRKQICRLLLKFTEEDSMLKDAARLRLAAVAAQDDDLNTAKDYVSSIKSIRNAVRNAGREILEDAYGLAGVLEKSDPFTSFSIYKDLAMIDINYRDAKSRRDKIFLGLPTEYKNMTGLVNPALKDGGATSASAGALVSRGLSFSRDISSHYLFNKKNAKDNRPSSRVDVDSGDTLGERYLLGETLGEGGMGTVFKAEDSRLKRTVAIKVLHSYVDDRNTEAGKRFELEAQLAGRLFQHKGVITVLDMYDGPPAYIVMEYVEGISLRDFIFDREMQDCEAAAILYQVADTLAYAHQQGIIHRDIKPANIMIEYMPLTAKVADFGLARLSNSRDHLTAEGLVVGTKLYMSPEQVKGKDITKSSDIYSWGITAYEMISGSPPFTEGEVAYQHVHVNPRKLTPANSVVKMPEPFLQLVMQCLEKAPEDRPFDFQNIKADMREIFPNLKDM